MCIKTVLCSMVALYLLASTASVFADDGDSQEIKDSLERVEEKLDTIAQNTQATNVVVASEPLKGKTQGIEINPIRFLMIDSEEKTFSGTYSRFYVDKKIEVAFPFMWTSAKHDPSYSYLSQPAVGEGSARSITLDAHFRKFLGRTMNGFYLSGFVRGVTLKGVLEDGSGNKHSENKLGMGFGVGYRIFSASNYYWGTSLSVGRYMIGDSDIYEDTYGPSYDLDDSEAIIDVEFFKFGYSF